MVEQHDPFVIREVHVWTPEQAEEVWRQLRESFGKIHSAVTLLAQATTAADSEFRRFYLNNVVRAEDRPGPTDPRERALWLRRNRNTGPRVRPRAPRSISPRGQGWG